MRHFWSVAKGSRRRAVLGALLATVAFTTTACSVPFATPPSLTASAVFSDVGGLASGAPVELGDLPVGRVTSITLDGTSARVRFIVNRSARVPADLTAQLRRTTILGQQYIELAVDHARAGQPLLANGATITRTEVVPGLSQLLSSGAAVFGAVNSTDLAQLVATGAQGLGGQGARLRTLLDNFGTVLKGYAGQTGEISALVGNMDRLTASLAPSAGPDARAVSTLATTTTILADQSVRFENLLQAIDNLSVQGRSILQTYVSQIDANLTGLASTAHDLYASEHSLVGLIDAVPGNNAALASITSGNELQVLADLVVCGLPMGGATSTQPALSCGGAG